MPNKGRKILENGGPRRIRTPNPLIRSQVLYPVELWVRCFWTKVLPYQMQENIRLDRLLEVSKLQK